MTTVGITSSTLLTHQGFGNGSPVTRGNSSRGYKAVDTLRLGVGVPHTLRADAYCTHTSGNSQWYIFPKGQEITLVQEGCAHSLAVVSVSQYEVSPLHWDDLSYPVNP